MTVTTIRNVRHRDSIGHFSSDGFVSSFARHRHHDVVEPRARQVDAARVSRIAAEMVDKAVAPMLDKLHAMGAQLDRVKAHQDAVREAERTATLPAGYVRDAASGEIRRRLTSDIAAANYAQYGRDVNGRRPGEPGYNFDGIAMAKAGATRQQINDAYWGRKA